MRKQMTNKPVAYIRKTAGGTYLSLTPISNDYGAKTDKTLFLYTKEQLQPKVQMTQKQYDRLMWDKENADLFQCIEYFKNNSGESNFGIPTDDLMGELTQEDIAKVWLNPEETIEIVPNKKWFVRVDSQIPLPDENIYLDDELIVYPHYNSPKSSAHQFDTKEQAEEWCNPLTEAVLLPVEGE